MKLWQKTIVAIILVSLIYWRLELVFGLACDGRVGGVFQCILIIICTAVVLRKLELLKSDEKKEDSEGNDKA